MVRTTAYLAQSALHPIAAYPAAYPRRLRYRNKQAEHAETPSDRGL